ncbi:MAG: LPS-assembly protein LptD [Gammaproteobacteria bacterium]|nr:LPS-assembly protein LptD [Gammaproteobacteria bacterium]
MKRFCVRLYFGVSLAFFALWGTVLQAQENEQCYLPLPALQFENISNGDNEFGLETKPIFDHLISPGKPTFSTSQHVIGADRIFFDQEKNVIRGEGNSRILSEGLQVDADSVTFQIDQDHFTARDLEFSLYEHDEDDPSIWYMRVRGQAKEFETQQEVLHLEDIDFTLCPEGNDDVVMSSSEVTLDPHSRQGVARNPKIRFKNTPILQLPYLRFPIGSDRLSGFLYPKFDASEKRGTSIEVPYYFNLAPNQDATLTTTYHSKRGAQLYTEYRYLGQYSDLMFLGEFMPRDERYINRDPRYAGEITGKLHNGGSLYSSFDVSWVSDDKYLYDYEGDFSVRDPDYLEQNVSLSYANYGMVVSVGVNKFLNSQPDFPAEDEPYNREPWISFEHVFPVARNSAIATSIVSDKFRKKGRPNSRRVHGQTVLSTRIANSYFETNLEVGGEVLKYRLDEPGDNQSATMEVESTFASLDGKLFFERYSANGSGDRWMLIPRLKILASEDVDQSNLPDLDTSLMKLDTYERIFHDRPYIGGDRVRDADQISVGISAHYDNLTNSSLEGSVGIGRVFYPGGHTLSVTDPDNQSSSGDELQKSDIYFEAGVKFHETEFDYHALVSTETNKISSSTMRLLHSFSEKFNLTSIFRHQRTAESQWGNELIFELDSGWLMGFQFIRSFQPNELESARISLNYQSCCSRVGVNLERERQLDGSYDNSIGLVFDLTPQY